MTTPDSMLPHQFAAQKREPGTNAQERFEAEMKELRARMPFLTATAVWRSNRFFKRPSRGVSVAYRADLMLTHHLTYRTYRILQLVMSFSGGA